MHCAQFDSGPAAKHLRQGECGPQQIPGTLCNLCRGPSVLHAEHQWLLLLLLLKLSLECIEACAAAALSQLWEGSATLVSATSRQAALPGLGHPTNHTHGCFLPHSS